MRREKIHMAWGNFKAQIYLLLSVGNSFICGLILNSCFAWQIEWLVQYPTCGCEIGFHYRCFEGDPDFVFSRLPRCQTAALTLISMFVNRRNQGNDTCLITVSNFRQTLTLWIPDTMKKYLDDSPLLITTSCLDKILYGFCNSKSLDYGRIQTSITAFKGKYLL